jgi:hypothetical protein
MSGTGKSSLIAELAALGYKAVDTDAGWCEPQPDGRQRWREDAIQALLASEDTDELFVAGCADCEMDTTMPLSDVVRAILKTVGAERPPGSERTPPART